MVNWIFPIAGYGTRTSSLGNYKPFVEVMDDYSILRLCLLGLKSIINAEDNLVFITTDFYEQKSNVEHVIRNLIKKMNLNNSVNVVTLPSTPNGQAHTLKEGVEMLGSGILKERVFVINSDQMIFFNPAKVDMSKCSVGLYFNDEASSCFYDLDLKSNLVTKIKEKQRISAYASAGVFYFTTAQQLLNCIDWGIKNDKYYNGELYLGPCMEALSELSFFKTLVKFDLGNVKNIKLFKEFGENFISQEKKT